MRGVRVAVLRLHASLSGVAHIARLHGTGATAASRGMHTATAPCPAADAPRVHSVLYRRRDYDWSAILPQQQQRRTFASAPVGGGTGGVSDDTAHSDLIDLKKSRRPGDAVDAAREGASDAVSAAGGAANATTTTTGSDGAAAAPTPPATDRREVTLYIKGFLGRGESPRNWDRWLSSHYHLEYRCQWGADAVGYYWDSGDPTLDVPLSNMLQISFKYLSKARWGLAMLGPHGVAALAAQELGTLGFSMFQTYRKAEKNTSLDSHILADKIKKLRAKYTYVRIVAHSLGARLALNACDLLDESTRPDELHLCAPAITQQDCAALLVPTTAKRGTYVYKTSSDYILQYMFKLLSYGESAVGETGLLPAHLARLSNVTEVDVSEHFDTFVHTEYAQHFRDFAVDVRGEQ